MTPSDTRYPGRWYGAHCYFGFHHDLHVTPEDTVVGTRCEDLVAMLRLAGAEFVQTDSKGHPGYTSWYSATPEANGAPGVAQDALAQWRAATRALGIPLHAHYSGIWDAAAGAKHPDWCIRNADGSPAPYTYQGWSTAPGVLMCPRGPYVDELLIPQLLEMIDRYDVDGFWVDGDIWAMQPCYCPRCRRAYVEETGDEPPTEESDPRWARWWDFSRRGFEAYVTRYCDAVHRHKPAVLITSAWLQTFKHPGAPTAPTDWISGDNFDVWGLDSSRAQARFISTRGKPWDLMLWDFYSAHGGGATSPHVTKPVQMLLQEAAVVTALGGSVQVCDAPWAPCGLRTGQHVPWRMRRLREMSRFVKVRRALCRDTETVPQVAVLHSEYHTRATVTGHKFLWNIDTGAVEGAVYGVLENHYGVDVLDEWALLPRMAEFPVIVAPEQHAMSDEMVDALKAYVAGGGKLLLTGAAALERFGTEFLGVTAGALTGAATYHLPAADGATPVHSAAWRLLEPAGARALFALGATPLRDEYLLPHPGATLRRHGRGKVLYVPGDLFRDFAHNRYPLTRALIGALVRKLAGRFPIEVRGPLSIDVVLRRQGRKILIHLINRASGIPNQPHNGAVDEIPPVGPITITCQRATAPRNVRLAFETAAPTWAYTDGTLRVTVPSVHIHAAVVIE